MILNCKYCTTDVNTKKTHYFEKPCRKESVMITYCLETAVLLLVIVIFSALICQLSQQVHNT